MGVIRVNKNKNYTTMSNYHLRDKNLSLKAKGLLSVMLSLPEDWDYSIAGLVSICKESELAVKNALKELKTLGYVEIVKLMPNETESGRLEYIYNVYEKPIEKQGGENQPLENQTLDNQEVEKSGQLITKELNTKKLNTKEYVKERKSSSYNDILDNMVTDPKLKEALIEFIKMRKLSKKPPTDHALELLIKKLFKMSSDTETQIEIVEQSITNNWQGFFPLKQLEGGKGKNWSSVNSSSRDKQYQEFEKMAFNFATKDD